MDDRIFNIYLRSVDMTRIGNSFSTNINIGTEWFKRYKVYVKQCFIVRTGVVDNTIDKVLFINSQSFAIPQHNSQPQMSLCCLSNKQPYVSFGLNSDFFVLNTINGNHIFTMTDELLVRPNPDPLPTYNFVLNLLVVGEKD